MNNVEVQNKIKTAIRQGKKSLQINGKRIKLPEAQRTGTYSQIEAYITQQTDKIMKLI